MASSSSSGDLRLHAKKLLSWELQPTPFLTFLSDLFSSDDSLRSEAEKLFNIMKNDYPNSLCARLAGLLRSSPRPVSRTNSAVILRRLLRRDGSNIWPRLSTIYQNELKENLIYSLRNETDPEVSKKLCSTIAPLAVQLLPRNEWPEFHLFVFQALRSASTDWLFEVFLLFAELSPEIGEVLSAHEDELHDACVMYLLLNSVELHVRVAAVGASVSLILYLSMESSHNKYEDLPSYMVRTLYDVISQEQVLAGKVLEDMIVLAGAKTGILRKHIDFLLKSMLSIAELNNVAEKTMELAIEFVLTVAEDRKQGCGMIEKFGNHITRLLSVLMNMLVIIEDDLSWYESDSDDDDYKAGESSKFCYGMKALGRLAVALRGNAIVPNYPEVLPELLVDKDWKKRHAVITALMLISEGTSKVLINEHLERLMKKVLEILHDPHPRVRWAAINAVGQFSKDLGPHLQQQFHQQLVPALTAAMDDFQNPRVQAQAASAMQLFSHNCMPSDILKPYLKGIVSKLLEFLQKGKRMLKEVALTALASIASLIQDDFQQYYETVMPYLNLILISETNKSNGMLVAKSMECITMIGLAVGKEKFSSDASQVVEVLISLQQSQVETHDPIRGHLLQAWGRLCKCLGQEFLPYMSVAMPQLLQSAQLKNYLCVNTNSNRIDESNDESMKGLTSTSGGFGIKTYVLEEKALACDMLCCCAAELKEGLHLWINEIAHTLVPLLKVNIDEEVRSAAITAMPLLLHAAISAKEKPLQLPGFNECPIKELTQSIIPSLVEALNKESNRQICAKILDSLNECIQISGFHMKKTHVTHIVDGIMEVLIASSLMKTEREKRAKAEDLGAGEWELLKEEIEQEEKVCNKISDCLDTLIKTFKASFLPLYDKILPLIAHMWGNDKTAKERKIALRIFYNIAEQCQKKAFRYYEICLPHLFKAFVDKNPEVRQIVAHGIGICAQFGGSVFKPHVTEALSKIEAAIKNPNALLPDNILAYEAAVSAFGKICYLHCDGLQAYQVAFLWLSHLPIRNDLREAKVVHNQLCSMVEKSKEDLDPENENLSKIIKIFAEVIWAGNNLATEQTVGRMIKLLKLFQQKFTPAKLGSMCSSIPLHHQKMLESIFSS